jgi:hypothetical protein
MTQPRRGAKRMAFRASGLETAMNQMNLLRALSPFSANGEIMRRNKVSVNEMEFRMLSASR